MMITKEDASSTFEFKDRYIILPENVFKYQNRKYLYNKSKGKKVHLNTLSIFLIIIKNG